MCGIVGRLNLTEPIPINNEIIRRMLAMIRHRGPDEFGLYLDEWVGLGSARLSIIDLAGGQQPIANENKTLWIVFNGEIFNYIELRPILEARGHRFTTHTDTEVVLHLYEEFGPGCMPMLNGQFAFAIWNSQTGSLFMARDRLGIRPLFYTVGQNTLTFGSEIKAILAAPGIHAEINPPALDQIFTYWSVLSPQTIFKNIYELPPGHYLRVNRGQVTITPYWQLTFPDRIARRTDYLAEFRELLIDATRIRLRADVPVGAYLSGGLDSSTIAAIIRRYTSNRLDTFSITFGDAAFDEREFQQQMARYLGTTHQVVQADYADIGRVFPEVIWHTETPLMRTSPAPLFLLSKLVHDHRFKVVMTGEGADEFLAGYNIFKEAKIRRFWAKQPDSALRPLLLKRLYPYIAALSEQRSNFLMAFFRQGLSETTAPDYSHAIRWHNTSRAKRFFADDLRQAIRAGNGSAPLTPAYPADFLTWEPLHQAQYLEITIFLSQYLLCSQGDRVAMAHSVEGRFPFLDYRLVEFCNRLPPDLKLHRLTEKYLLKQLAGEWLPTAIWQRPKRPYRAPIHRSFFHPRPPAYVTELLSAQAVKTAGLFNPMAVNQLVQKIKAVGHLSETDDMALAGILSTQLVHQQFIAGFRPAAPLPVDDGLKIIDRQTMKGKTNEIIQYA